MKRRTLARLAIVTSLPLVASTASLACGDSGGTTDTGGGGSCVAHLEKGQLIITEFMPDPAGSDADGDRAKDVGTHGKPPRSALIAWPSRRASRPFRAPSTRAP